MKRKKILIFLPSITYGGAELFVLDLINNLSKKYEVVFVVSKGVENKSLIPENIDKFYTISSSSTLFSFLKLRKIILKESPSVCFSTIWNANIALILSCIGLSIPVVIREAGQEYRLSGYSDGNKYIVNYLIAFLFYRFANKIICVSNSMQSNLIRNLRISADKTIVVKNNFYTEKFKKDISCEPNHKWIKNQNLNVISCVSRLDKVRELDLLIKAFSEFVKNEEIKKNFRLVIFGDGNWRKYLEELVVNLDIKEVVDLPGFFDPVINEVHHSDLYIHPSRSEGYSNALGQSLLTGVKTIASDIPQNQELGKEFKNCFFYEQGNTYDLLKKIYEVRDFSKIAIKHFSYDETYENYEKIINEL
tara:strand:+ start:1894 stop:2979 length:1086 start_codon:yes stop_codon:yes gene_type:complete